MVLQMRTANLWRTHPDMLLKNNVWRQFPGLATATCIFVSYVAFDKLIPSFGGGGHHGHDDHGAGHGDHGAAAPKPAH